MKKRRRTALGGYSSGVLGKAGFRHYHEAMTRNFSSPGLVLRVRPSGEANREATFLTAGEGIVRATVFGGAKSRLRAQAAPYHEGMVWFYRDPVKDYYKVTDFEVRSWRPGLRESYARSMAAAAVAETLLASHGGGSAWGEALSLAGDTLDALEGAEEEAVRRVAIRFFWNWGDVLGLRPGTVRCAACGRSLEGGETAWYSRREGQLFCAPCADPGRPGETAEFLPLSAGTRRWLRAVEALPPAEPGPYALDRILEKEAASLTQEILAAALGRRLSTWNW